MGVRPSLGPSLRAALRPSLGPLSSGAPAAPQIITATVQPSLVAVDWTNTPADAYVAGTYASTAGTISSAVPTYLVNGVSQAGTYDLLGGETLTVTVLVTDSVGNTRTFSAGSIVVASQAPDVTAVDSLSARVLTVTATVVAGQPAPSLSIAATLDGSPIAASGTNPWTITVPSSAASQTVSWTVTATNSAGTDTATGSEVVAADLAAPVITGVPTISGTAQVGQTLTATAASVTGTPTPTRTWQWNRDGSPISGATSSTYLIDAADEGSILSVTQTETNSVGSASATSAGTDAVTVASGGITFLGVEFSDFSNNLSVGTLPNTTFTIPAGCDAVLALVINSFREADANYTPISATLNGTAMHVGADTGALAGGFHPTAHILALTLSGGLVEGAQTLSVDRPGNNAGGALHVAMYYLQGAAQDPATWVYGVAASLGATSLTTPIDVLTAGSFVASHAGPRRPGDFGGAATINYTTLPVEDGFDDTDSASSTNNNSLGTKWAHEENAAAGLKNISPSWGASVRCALASAAVGPA